jgi:hypothetical protein
VFLSIECELPREDSRRDHWHRRNRSQQQVIVGRDSTRARALTISPLGIGTGRYKSGRPRGMPARPSRTVPVARSRAWPCSSTFRARALPTPVITGTYRWIRRTERLSDHAALADLEQRLRGESDLPRLIARLDLEGSLPIGDYAELQRVSLISRRRFFISTSTSARSSLVRPTPISKPSTSTAFYGDAPTGCVALETIPSALRTCTTAPKRLLWSSTSASRATRPRRLRDADQEPCR